MDIFARVGRGTIHVEVLIRIIDQVVNQGTGAATQCHCGEGDGRISVYDGLRRCSYTGVHRITIQ